MDRVAPAGLEDSTHPTELVDTLEKHNHAHHEHRHAQRHDRDGEEVLDLAIPQLLDGRVVGRPLDPAVPALVVVPAVAVLFAVGVVVLGVKRDEIVEGEAVMTGREVDALLRLAPLVAVDFV